MMDHFFFQFILVPGVKRQRHKEPAFADTTYLSQPIVPEIILPQFDVPYCVSQLETLEIS